MGTLEEIKKMKESNMTEEEIVESLESRGIPKQEIQSAISQSQIKQAVSSPPISQDYETIGSPGQYSNFPASSTEELSEMRPSLLASQEQEEASQKQEYIRAPEPAFTIPQSQYPDYSQPYQQYSGDYSYAPSVSPDTITEIAEQALAEGISPLKDHVNKLIDAKNTLSIKLEHLSSRLERIEKIIDRLQLSVLQKVGEYVNNVDEIKRELIETQKTFKAVADKHHQHHQK